MFVSPPFPSGNVTYPMHWLTGEKLPGVVVHDTPLVLLLFGLVGQPGAALIVHIPVAAWLQKRSVE
jgi:hypothetical protein